MPSQRSQQAAFERRHSAWEKRYQKQLLSYLKATYNDVAKQIANNGIAGWRVDTQGAFKIYRKLYQTVSIDEGRRAYNESVKPYLSGKKDMIDDLVEILSNNRDDNTIVSLWRELLNEFIDTRITGRITNISATTERKITEIIEEAILRGEGAEVIARTIRREAGEAFNQNRALSIARTETMTALNQGRYLAALSSPFEQEKKWSPVLDGRTRDGHADMYDDPYIDFKDEFFVRNAKGLQEVAQYPGDERMSAGNIINCYLPGNVIESNIIEGQRSFYSGEAIEIITVRGERLTVTPNHRILTPHGFLAAKYINVGDNLVCNSIQVNAVFRLVNNYIKKKLFRVENVFSSLEKLWISKQVVVSGLDFDEDGGLMDGDINIVYPKRKLIEGPNTPFFKRVHNFLFVNPTPVNISVSGFSPFHFFGSRNNTAPSRLMSLLHLSFPLLFRHFRPLNFFRLGLIPDIAPRIPDDSGDGWSADADFFRKLINTNSADVSLNKVVSIRVFNFTGHVYDFSSSDGVNIVNNIYTSNCRCSMLIRPKRGTNGRLIRKL